MDDVSFVDVILDFFQKYGFLRVEVVLCCELSNRFDRNGFQKRVLGEKEDKFEKLGVRNQEFSFWYSSDVFKEFIVKEIECGIIGIRNGKESKWNAVVENNMFVEGFIFLRGFEDIVFDLYFWNYNKNNGFSVSDFCQSSSNVINFSFIEFKSSGLLKLFILEVYNMIMGKVDVQFEFDDEIVIFE